MNVPVLGIVENMSYYQCPDCGKRHSIFGESHVEVIARDYGITTIAKLPIEPEATMLIKCRRLPRGFSWKRNPLLRADFGCSAERN